MKKENVICVSVVIGVLFGFLGMVYLCTIVEERSDAFESRCEVVKYCYWQNNRPLDHCRNLQAKLCPALEK